MSTEILPVNVEATASESHNLLNTVDIAGQGSLGTKSPSEIKVAGLNSSGVPLPNQNDSANWEELGLEAQRLQRGILYGTHEVVPVMSPQGIIYTILPKE
jgi:hypothetical protein